MKHKLEPSQWLGNGKPWIDLVGCFAIDIIAGNNIKLSEMRAQTVREYLESVNKLFTSRGYDAPTDFNQKKVMPALFYENLKTWETEPNRRTHMTPEFLAELLARADKEESFLSFTSAMRDWALLGRYAGLRLAEYGQEAQTRVAYHCIPGINKKKIRKAFGRGDFIFKDKLGNRVLSPHVHPHRIHSVDITWRVQKNRRNGQTITWVRDYDCDKLCPVLAAYRIYRRSILLNLRDESPMGAYKEKGAVKFITGSRISKLFKEIAQSVYPDITPTELSKFSAHMIRVSAAVLLQMADKPEHFIKTRLRWEGDSYKLYLRNTSVSARQHLQAASANPQLQAAYSISAANLNTTSQTTPPQLPEAAMGSYLAFN